MLFAKRSLQFLAQTFGDYECCLFGYCCFTVYSLHGSVGAVLVSSFTFSRFL